MTESLNEYQEREAEEGRREARLERAERVLDLNAQVAENTEKLREISDRISTAIKKGKQNEHDRKRNETKDRRRRRQRT